jgi:iron(III) transport system ATP-binding protein
MPTEAGAPPALACVGLVKRFGETVAVDGVDLEVPRGSLTALLGPSGCGKTTVLRMVAGLLTPDAGRIAIDGRIVTDGRTATPPERRNVGLVFQDYALFPHLTVARNVGYGLTSLDRRERRARVAEVLDLVGLGALGSRLPTGLSGGQQQRVALARALAPQPDLILLDEPFSNLDAALRANVREDVRAILHAADQTAVFVTHDQEEALSLADRVAVMADGRLHQVADPQQLYTNPATRFVAEFVGEADVLPGQRAGRYLVDTPIGRLPSVRPIEDREVAVMVRPEALRLRPDAAGAGTVVALSYFGHDQLVQVELDGGRTVRARRGPRLDLARGDRVSMDVDGPVLTFADQSSSRRSRIIETASGMDPSAISSRAGMAARAKNASVVADQTRTASVS